MERSENAALDSSTPSEPQLDCLAHSLVQLLETAKQDLDHDREFREGIAGKSVIHSTIRDLVPP
jgi:hypothetical protein